MFGRWDCLGCLWRSQIAPPLLWQAVNNKCLVAGALVCLVASYPLPARAATLSDVDFANLAVRCAPAVPEWVLGAVARTESNFQPWILHDNTAHTSDSPVSLAAAEVTATAWIAEGHSVDLGLMQINAANLPALGMTVREALDPCASLAAGAAVLRAAYGDGSVGAGHQTALLMALSIYNTGTPLKGIMNGYARTVMRNAGETIASVSSVPLRPTIAPDLPPAWDVSATGIYMQAHGAPWLVPLGLGVTAQSVVAARDAGSPRQPMRSP